MNRIKTRHSLLFSLVFAFWGLLLSQTTHAVYNSSLPISYVILSSPNGGEEWIIGTTKRVAWTSSVDVESVSLTLVDVNNVKTILSFGALPNTGYYDWKVDTYSAIGKTFKVGIIGYGSNLNALTNPSDRSDNYFYISENMSTPTPVVTYTPVSTIIATPILTPFIVPTPFPTPSIIPTPTNSPTIIPIYTSMPSSTPEPSKYPTPTKIPPTKPVYRPSKTYIPVTTLRPSPTVIPSPSVLPNSVQRISPLKSIFLKIFNIFRFKKH